jgi:hypothetical protein
VYLERMGNTGRHVESDSHIAGSDGFHAGHRRLGVRRSRVPANNVKVCESTFKLLLIPGKLGEVIYWPAHRKRGKLARGERRARRKLFLNLRNTRNYGRVLNIHTFFLGPKSVSYIRVT